MPRITPNKLAIALLAAKGRWLGREVTETVFEKIDREDDDGTDTKVEDPELANWLEQFPTSERYRHLEITTVTEEGGERRYVQECEIMRLPSKIMVPKWFVLADKTPKAVKPKKIAQTIPPPEKSKLSAPNLPNTEVDLTYCDVRVPRPIEPPIDKVDPIAIAAGNIAKIKRIEPANPPSFGGGQNVNMGASTSKAPPAQKYTFDFDHFGGGQGKKMFVDSSNIEHDEDSDDSI